MLRQLRQADVTFRKIPLEPGGMIILSTDVNAMSEGGVLGRIKNWLKTQKQRYLSRKKQSEKAIEEEKIKSGLDQVGWTFGNLFDGRFTTEINGEIKVFDEKSFAIDISGVDFKFVEEVAKNLVKKFNQKSALLINNQTNERMLLEQEESGVIKKASASEGYWIDAKSGKKYSVTGTVHSKWIQDPNNASKVQLSKDVFKKIRSLDFPKDDDEIRKLTIQNTDLIRMRQHGAAMSFEFSDSRPSDSLWTINDFLEKNAGPFTFITINNFLPSGIHSFSGNFKTFKNEMMESDKVLSRERKVATSF